jgi:hypothetical protein
VHGHGYQDGPSRCPAADGAWPHGQQPLEALGARPADERAPTGERRFLGLPDHSSPEAYDNALRSGYLSSIRNHPSSLWRAFYGGVGAGTEV